MVTHKQRQELTARAYFMSSANRVLRRRNSSTVDSAIEDAVAFLDKLPRKAIPPYISSGNQQTILDLFWTVNLLHLRGRKWRKISVTFRGYGDCIARWPDDKGKEHTRRHISVKQVSDLKLAAKVRHFRRLYKDATKKPTR